MCSNKNPSRQLPKFFFSAAAHEFVKKSFKAAKVGKWSLRGKDAEPDDGSSARLPSLGQGMAAKPKILAIGAMGPQRRPFFGEKIAKKAPARSRAEPERQACGPSQRKCRSFAFPRAGNGARAKALGNWSNGASGAGHHTTASVAPLARTPYSLIVIRHKRLTSLI